ncbi:MAG: HlyD family efflux transporter periplasmic adaptor subunit [Dehalococcoidia bacterium]
MSHELDIDALIRGGHSPRWRTLAIIAALGVLAAAAVTYFVVRGDEPAPTVAPTESTATTGQLTTTIDLSGSATPAFYEALTFGVAGDVTALSVAAGDTVEAGQVLAQLDTSALELAVRDAEVSLTAQQANLADIVGSSSDPGTAVQIANARQSVATSESRVTAAQDALDALVSPSNADVARAEADMLAAESTLEAAEDELDLAHNGPSAAALASADSAVASAQSRLISTADAVVSARNVDGIARTLSEIVAGNTTATADQIVTLILQKPKDPLVSGAALTAAEAEYVSAKAQLEAVIADRDELTAPATASVLASARNAVTLAQDSYDEARAAAERLAAAWRASNLGEAAPADDDDVRLARTELEAAEAGLEASQADLAEVLAGPEASSVASAQLAVVRAEQSLLEARQALDAATLVAPFAGTIQSVSISSGDTVAANAAVVELLDESAIEVDLTVTESDLPDIEVGQIGLATFDSIDGQQYPVRIASISRVPNTEQGVVTYPVTAVLLQGADLADAADEMAALTGAATTGAPAGAFPGAGGPAGPFADIDLPDGVSMQDILQALANDEPLPDGVTLPEGFEIPETLLERIRSGATGPVGGGETGPAAAPDGASQRPMPAPGMSASVTLLTEIRDEAVLVPVNAVRLIDDVPTVRIPADDGTSTRIEVTLGSSDGEQVEVLSGLEAGDIVLVGAETEGVPYTVTTQSSSSQTQGGFFFGGNAPPDFNRSAP